LVITTSYAQINACTSPSNPGETINATEFGASSYGTSGDLYIISDPLTMNPVDPETADWYLSGNAQVDVYSAIIIPAGTMVTLKSGAILNIYGNMVNEGILNIEPGATINFYGELWTNGATAYVRDGDPSINTTPGGTINFIASR